MNSTILLFAAGIGLVAGLRSLTAPAVVAWAAHLGWINLHNSPLAFMGSKWTVVIFTVHSGPNGGGRSVRANRDWRADWSLPCGGGKCAAMVGSDRWHCGSNCGCLWRLLCPRGIGSLSASSRFHDRNFRGRDCDWVRTAAYLPFIVPVLQRWLP